MKRIYGKTVSELFREFVKNASISKGTMLNRSDILQWFEKNYPKILKSTLGCQIIKHSTNAPSRIYYEAGPVHDLFFQIDRNHFRLYDASTDPVPIYRNKTLNGPGIEIEEPEEPTEREFAYEKDLQQFLVKNLDIIEKGLELYKDPEDETITGLEFPCGQKSIDVLALDKNKDFVVIELKVSKGYERVVGQLARYVAWVKKNMAQEGQKVRGIVIAREISEDLRLAASEISNVGLFEYELKVVLKKIDNSP